MLDLLNFQEKLENHVFVLNSPRISVPLQYLYIVGGLVNGHDLYGGRFGIISAKSEGLYPLTQRFRFQKYIAQMHLYTHVIARVYGNSPQHC